MKTYTYIKKINSLTPNEMNKLDRLHFKWGCIYTALAAMYNGYERINKDDRVIICKDVSNNKIIGWGLFYYNQQYDSNFEFQLWVNTRIRRKGIGLKISKCLVNYIENSMKRTPRIAVYGTNKGEGFFRSEKNLLRKYIRDIL